MEGCIRNIRQRPGGAVTGGGAFHRAAIPEEENIGGTECEQVVGHDHTGAGLLRSAAEDSCVADTGLIHAAVRRR